MIKIEDCKSPQKKPFVFWLTGLSGVGKSTIAGELVPLLKAQSETVFHLDGDRMRSVFGIEDDHRPETRVRLGLSYVKLAKLLSEHGATVVWSSVSIFPKVFEWARANLPNYRQIYIEAPREVL